MVIRLVKFSSFFFKIDIIFYIFSGVYPKYKLKNQLFPEGAVNTFTKYASKNYIFTISSLTHRDNIY